MKPARAIVDRDLKPDDVSGRGVVEIEVTHAPSPVVRDRLVDLLVELLDARRRSGRR